MNRKIGNAIAVVGLALISAGAAGMNFCPNLGTFFVGLLMLPLGLAVIVVGMVGPTPS
jgi:hypothetical protein